MDYDPQIPAWHQQPGEKSNWFVRFDAFAKSGPGRSMLSIYNAERKKKGKDPTKSVPSSWRNQADSYDWKTRAQKYDAHLIEERRQQDEEQREKIVKSRRTAIMIMQNMVTRLLIAEEEKSKNGNAVDIKDLESIARSASIVMKESRIEFGEPTDITDIQTMGQPVSLSVDQMADKLKAARNFAAQYEQDQIEEDDLD